MQGNHDDTWAKNTRNEILAETLLFQGEAQATFRPRSRLHVIISDTLRKLGGLSY